MHVVVIGLGEVGKHLLGVLDRQGHDVVAIDRSQAATVYAEQHFDVATITGYGASESILKSAGVPNSDLVIAVTDNDEVNLIAALAAKNLGARRVVARAQGNEWAEWEDGVKLDLWGIDVVINPRILVGQEMAKIALSHGASDVITLAEGRVELAQIEIGKRQVGKPLSKLELPRECLIAAIVRNDELVIPGGVDVLEEGDLVYLIGLPKAVIEAESLFTARREANRICIFGGGVIGQSLAKELLEQDAHVTIIERDRDQAERLLVELHTARVFHGDGTDQEFLTNEAEIDTHQFFCAATDEDEVNLMASLIAKSFVPAVGTVVNRANYIPIYKSLGLNTVLSPRSVASDHIIGYATRGDLNSLHKLANGLAEVVELTAHADCRAVNTPIRHMNLPRGALVAAIVDGNKVVIPRGDDEVGPSNRVILLVTPQAQRGVERLFRSRRG